MPIAVQTAFTDMELNRGFMYDRTKFGGLEKAFAEYWEQENEIKPWLNQGCGLLQNLFFLGNCSCHHHVTPSERFVAATVVQWLGTNCGFAFLQEVLRSEGLYITEIPKHKPLPAPPPERKWFSRRLA